jgi:hypothetical protein
MLLNHIEGKKNKTRKVPPKFGFGVWCSDNKEVPTWRIETGPKEGESVIYWDYIGIK